MLFRSLVRKLNTNSLSAQSVVAAKLMRVSGLDHDGCFGVPHLNPSQTVLFHQPVIDLLKERAISKKYAFDYVTSTSNRQSIEIDCMNAIKNQNNLAFPVATEIAKSLGGHFDPLLLADITANRKPGFTIRLIKSAIAANGANPLKDGLSDEFLLKLMNEPYAKYCFSLDKVNILYPQMHRMAMMHPVLMIEFDIYDDLHAQVLKPLGSFYEKYHSLIPANLKLKLYHYNTANKHDYSQQQPELPTLVNEIQGSGKTDTNYYSTVNAMSDVAIKEEGIRPSYHLADYLTPATILASLAAQRAKQDSSLNHRFRI